MKMKKLLIVAVLISALLGISQATTINAQDVVYNNCIDLEKTGPETAEPGQTITYKFTVTNCGELPLYAGYDVYDPLFGEGSIWHYWLKPGETAELYKDYKVTDDDCGLFTNTAEAIGHPIKPDGSQDSDVTDESSWTVEVDCAPPPCPCETDLIAGQHWNSGVVSVSDDGTNLYVKYEPSGGWSLGETHLYVGTTPPEKAAPGKFPYKDQTEYVIPLADLGVGDGDVLYIAAHAVVYNGDQEETAWADTYGTRIGKNWAMYFGYEVGSGCFKPEP